MEHLVANSGIQFIKKEIEFNPAEPLILPSNRPLKYSFCDYADFITGEKVFDFLYYHQRDDMFIPVKEMIASGHLERSLNGRECLDETGLVKLLPNTSSTLYSSFQQGDPGVITMNALDRFRVVNPNGDGREQISAFELLLDKWLPMPMFEKSVDGVTADVPMGWCRLRLQELGDGEVKGNKRYRLVWAFDTDLSEDFLSSLRPCFYDGDGVSKEYCLCNKVDELIRFMSVNSEFSAFADYIASVLGVADRNDSRYRAFYIYFMNFIRFSGGAPEITLHHQKPETDIEVDLVLDIGNSRTCGVLFEECQFTKAEMLQLRDLSRPWVVDKNTIDMRLVFRKADLGNDIVLNEDLFSWKSFVRVGEEAKRLVYRSLEDEGLAGKTTNYSSPKRYLWDEKAYCGRWENLTTVDDPFNVRLSDNIFIPGLSPLFDNQGKFNPNPDPLAGLAGSDTHYSRSSLMTFVFIELLQQALMQINSIGFRTHWGKINFRRKLRNIIITCPTAMPKKEQIKLRECAVDAAKALSKCNVLTNAVNIVPSPESLNVKDDDMDVPRVWSFDEASCCQLVYLYAEIKQRYDGEVHKFFEMKGHVRPELKESGYERKALTIGTIDIGAGTTDVMIAAYEYEGEGRSRVKPIPLYWDSFYIAGDDILCDIIKNILIEGKVTTSTTIGNISSVLTNRILPMSDVELSELPCLKREFGEPYKKKVEDILRSVDEQEKVELKKELASNLIHGFFGNDSANLSYKDLRCRVDFNTMISLPIAQKWLDLLRLKRPSKVYTFDELFASSRPADYLLEHFYNLFGFRFEELSWRFEPQEVAHQVKDTMERLMRQLSMVMYAHNCDIIVLAGRPSSLDAVTELFIKYMPVSPDRLIRMTDGKYNIGKWYPLADPQGFLSEPKTMVAVGGMVGHLAQTEGFNGLVIDFSEMNKVMRSTAKYIGKYKSRSHEVEESALTPTRSMMTFKESVFPVFLGCRLFDSSKYVARPLYALYNNSNKGALEITISRDYRSDREELHVDSVTDIDGNDMQRDAVELVLQSIVDDGTCWLDKGAFELEIRKN